MPKPVSQEQRAANRQNAAKSTGPKTPEGKARAARNALKHGLLSAQVVVDAGDGAERPEEFHALLESLIEDFDPQNVIEQSLVERVAACLWRLRRAQRFEVGALRESLDECQRDDGVKDGNDPDCSDCPSQEYHACDQLPYCDCATCGDGQIDMCEAVGCAAAWRWGDHNDMAAAMRGLYLWMQGDCYRWDESEGNWIPESCD